MCVRACVPVSRTHARARRCTHANTYIGKCEVVSVLKHNAMKACRLLGGKESFTLRPHYFQGKVSVVPVANDGFRGRSGCGGEEKNSHRWGWEHDHTFRNASLDWL
jgi:hypothetical protein